MICYNFFAKRWTSCCWVVRYRCVTMMFDGLEIFNFVFATSVITLPNNSTSVFCLCFVIGLLRFWVCLFCENLMFWARLLQFWLIFVFPCWTVMLYWTWEMWFLYFELWGNLDFILLVPPLWTKISLWFAMDGVRLMI